MAKNPTSKRIGVEDRGGDGQGKTALVTGASSGIGRAMAELLAAKSYRVIVLARRRERLHAISRSLHEQWGVDVVPLVADLADPATPELVLRQLASSATQVDLLVNNAGFSAPGRYDTRSWVEHERQLRVMGLASLELTHRLVPAMLDRGWGRIINVASITGLFAGTPRDVVYGATKALLISFTLGLDAELRAKGIRCTVSLPGVIDTEIFEASGLAESVSANPLYRAALMQPETVARQAYAGVMRGRPVVIPGNHYKALAFVVQHAPASMRRALSNALTSGVEPGPLQ